MLHRLKILPEYYEAVKSGEKTFEIRRNDRGFTPGDELILQEYDGKKLTGRRLRRRCGYIYEGVGKYGLRTGYCVIALKRRSQRKEKE